MLPAPGAPVDDRPVVDLAADHRHRPGSGDAAGTVAARWPSVDQRPAGEAQEDVLEGGAADQHGQRVAGRARGPAASVSVAVVGVEQQPVGQHLDPVGEVGDPLGELPRGRPTANRSSSDLAGGVVADQLRRRALGDDPALVHDHQPVAELLGLVHVVGGEHQRHALLLEPEQPVPEQVPGLRVEAGGRLVEQQQLGLVDQRRGRSSAGASCRRRGRRPWPSALSVSCDELEQLVGARADLAARQPEVAAVDDEVVADGELGVEGVLLRADAEPGRGSPGRRVAGSRPRMRSSPPVGGETQPIIRIVEDLPAPFGPRKPNASPGRTSTSMPVDRDEVAEALAQPAGPDHARWSRRSSAGVGPG